MLRQKPITPYLYLAAPFLVLLTFIYYPIIRNIQYSFYRWNAFSPDMAYIGLQNYTDLFHDPLLYSALANNVWYAVISVVCQVGGGLVVAAILEDRAIRRWAPFFRTVYFLPVIISITVIALLFDFIYNPEVGLLNGFLKAVGLESWSHAWLGESGTAMFSVIAVSQWQSVGYVAMLFIVAIQKIPGELYEAAEIDGAGRWRMFVSVTLPQVKEMAFVTTTVTLTQAFTVFNEPYILTGGGPGHASEVLGTLLYKTAFVKDLMGYASSIAVFMMIVTLAISLLQMKLFRSGEEA
ncbi:carbohydrate ABC transporter permease [Paenibacillus tyrfis]|uniref:carbohydrate ABC transporter permease n=1 Tax=Paenibacillus tyrfis TaxID=1501230 RepID=UPI00209CC298|nr:sugar ABC transporter permease [Paenibacillus tyrfis]MCP1309084.1 sugar ABC transporter permease [Paenibacillus tyrfis]